MNSTASPSLRAKRGNPATHPGLRHMLLDCRVATLLAMTGRSYKDTLA